MANSYQQEIANWRQQRRQAEAQSRLQELRQEHAEAIRERDQAVASNDLELAASADDQAQYLENEYAQLVGPQPQPVDPRLQQFEQRNRPYLNNLRARVGPERAGQFLNWVDQRVVNSGIPRNSPEYFRRGRDFLELYSGPQMGVAYDSKDQALTANQAAKISGLSASEYNRAAKEIGAQGRYSWQQKK
jgi:hypothetical protein